MLEVFSFFHRFTQGEVGGEIFEKLVKKCSKPLKRVIPVQIFTTLKDPTYVQNLPENIEFSTTLHLSIINQNFKNRLNPALQYLHLHVLSDE